MAASTKFICSKSTFIQRQSRTIFTQSFLAKYNVGSNKKKKKPVRPLDDFIRHGKHENDLYETSMDLADRFVDPSVARRPKPHPETPKPGWYAAEHPRGRVFDKKPFPLYLKAGKRYLWCACGRSNRQFPAAANCISSDGQQGDFITLIYRNTSEEVALATSFNSSWRTGQQTEHEIETLGIPTSDLNVIYRFFADLTRSDHSSFWNGGFPAIFVTDTAENRGIMRACYHHPCDDLPTMLNDNNIRFLGKVSDILAATMDKLAVPDGKTTSGASPRQFFNHSALILAAFCGLHVTF